MHSIVCLIDLISWKKLKKKRQTIILLAGHSFRNNYSCIIIIARYYRFTYSFGHSEYSYIAIEGEQQSGALL